MSLTTIGLRASRAQRALTAAAALVAVAATLGASGRAAADCPWIVQPQDQAQDRAKASVPVAYDIVFDGFGERSKVFYGFTVASVDLAWRLSRQPTLPELRHDARRLEPRITADGTTAYQLASDTIEPKTIYLVAADSVIDQLERIRARIEPTRPLALSQLFAKTRGGSDLSGPLPHLSLPGFELVKPVSRAPDTGFTQTAAADLQICAYQVAMR